MWPALPWFKEPLFVWWISQLITVTVACLAAWKLPNFLAILPAPPPPHAEAIKAERGSARRLPRTPSRRRQSLAGSLPAAAFKPFPSSRGSARGSPKGDDSGASGRASRSGQGSVGQLSCAKPWAWVGATLNYIVVWFFVCFFFFPPFKTIFGRWERTAIHPSQNFLLTPPRAGKIFDFMRSSRRCWDKSFPQPRLCLWHYTRTLKCKGKKPDALQFSKELHFATKSSLLLIL